MQGDEQLPGILQLAVKDVLDQIEAQKEKEFLLRVSYIEIYNETVRDLLDPSTGIIAIRENPVTGVYTECTERIVSGAESLLKALEQGNYNRHVGATNMNEQSSRSHSIFRLLIESRDGFDQSVKIGCLNFVDLAGSESVRNTGSTGQRLIEAGKINRSLLALSRVIHALADKTDDQEHHINFRDSKLTRILQPSLSGNARMVFICCITPAEKYCEETKSTLKFASRAKTIQVSPVVNQIVDEKALVKRLEHEIRILTQSLALINERNGQLQRQMGERESSTYERDFITTSNKDNSSLKRNHEQKVQIQYIMDEEPAEEPEESTCLQSSLISTSGNSTSTITCLQQDVGCQTSPVLVSIPKENHEIAFAPLFSPTWFIQLFIVWCLGWCLQLMIVNDRVQLCVDEEQSSRL